MQVNQVYRFNPPFVVGGQSKPLLKYYGRHIVINYGGGIAGPGFTREEYVFGNPDGPDNPGGQINHSAGNGSLQTFPEPRYVLQPHQFNSIPGRYTVTPPAPGDVVGGRRKTRRRRRK